MRKPLLAPLSALVLAGSMLGNTALAGQTAPAPPPPAGLPSDAMMRADVDADGVISQAEFLAASDLRFARMDADHDGKVTADERRAEREAMRDRSGDRSPAAGRRRAPGMGRMADPNGDGMMTLEEDRARAADRFDRMDANHDGRLDRGELSAMRPMRRGPDAPPPPPPPLSTPPAPTAQ